MIVVKCKSKRMSSEYVIENYNIDDEDYSVVDIDKDFKSVVDRLALKGEKIDNKEVSDGEEYIKRMKNAQNVVYVYKNGVKVGFCYFANKGVYGPKPVAVSFVMIDTADVLATYLMYIYIGTQHKMMRMYPHGTVATEVKSVVTRDSLIAFHQKRKPYVSINSKLLLQMHEAFHSYEKFFGIKMEVGADLLDRHLDYVVGK